MKIITAVILLAFLQGCSQSPATLAGGKPVGYWVEALQNSHDAKSRKEAASRRSAFL